MSEIEILKQLTEQIYDMVEHGKMVEAAQLLAKREQQIKFDTIKEFAQKTTESIGLIPGDCEYGMITHYDAEQAISIISERLIEKNL